MEIVPLAAESLGVRSMATFVDTGEVRILCDPAAALGPLRYGYEPHAIELQRLENLTRCIEEMITLSDIVVITHYHFDHHDPVMADAFEGKELLLKDGDRMTNRSQSRRCSYFLDRVRKLVKSLRIADGGSFSFSDTKITFSEPVPHGATGSLGYVLEVSIRRRNESFLYTSDVQGPCLKRQTSFIIREKPEVVLCDGPMTYMLGQSFSHALLRQVIDNLKTVLRLPSLRRLVLDHHLLRDLRWRERMQPLFDEADKRGIEVLTMAEMLGWPVDPLEAKRKELYHGNTTG